MLMPRQSVIVIFSPSSVQASYELIWRSSFEFPKTLFVDLEIVECLALGIKFNIAANKDESDGP